MLRSNTRISALLFTIVFLKEAGYGKMRSSVETYSSNNRTAIYSGFLWRSRLEKWRVVQMPDLKIYCLFCDDQGLDSEVLAISSYFLCTSRSRNPGNPKESLQIIQITSHIARLIKRSFGQDRSADSKRIRKQNPRRWLRHRMLSPLKMNSEK